MPENTFSRVDPKLIQPGTEVEVDSYFGTPFQDGDGIIFQCEHPIGPRNSSDFTPSKFLLVPPPDSGHKVMVFSLEDIKYSRSPYYTDLERVPARPYFPISVLETQLNRTTRNLEKCDWKRPVSIASTYNISEIKDPLQKDLYAQLENSFLRGRHNTELTPSSKTDLIFTFLDLPMEGDVKDRVPEIEPMIIQKVSDDYNIQDEKGNRILHPNTMVVTSVYEDFSRMMQKEIEDFIWTYLARVGTFKMIFIHKDNQTGKAKSYTFATMEGGHSTNLAYLSGTIDELRDKLITHACAGKVEIPIKIPDVFESIVWDRSLSPKNIVETGRELGVRGVLERPVVVRNYTRTDKRAEEIRRLLGWLRQSPGAMIVYDPFLGIYIITGTGREEVDKTNMDKDRDLVAVRLENNQIEELGVIGRKTIGSSIEAAEYVRGFERVNEKVGKIKARLEDGYFIEDPEGDYKIPRWWGILHTHMGVEKVLPLVIDGVKKHIVRHIPQNLERFPFSIGCGKKLMNDFSEDVMERIDEMYGDDDEALVVLVDKGNHGTDFVLRAGKIPGTNKIPVNQFYHLMELIRKGYLRIEKHLGDF